MQQYQEPSRPTDSEFHFNKSPWLFAYTLKFERCLSRRIDFTGRVKMLKLSHLSLSI